MHRVLFVDVDPAAFQAAREQLAGEAEMQLVKRAELARGFPAGNFELVVVAQDGDPVALLEEVEPRFPQVPCLCLLDAATEGRAAEILGKGAADYLIASPHLALTLPLAIRRNLRLRALQASCKAAEAERERLLKAHRVKQDFLQQISHDLRTPLLTLRTYAQLLASGRLGELGGIQREKIETILRNADRLARAVEHIRRFERLEAEKIELVRETFDLKSLFADIVAAASHACLEKGITLGQSWPLSPVGVFADRELMVEVVKELLDNAIAATPERGSVAIAVTERPYGEVVVSVTDTGPGIAKEEIDHLAEPFCEREHAQGHSGYGLGLAIVNRILNLHHSALDIDSQPGRGTRVRFTLPVGEHVCESRRMTADQRRRVVLVVDDDDDNRACTRTVLELAGYEVLGANGLQEVREQLEQDHVDAVLLDVAMQGASGLETLRILKHYPATSSLPVLMVSGCADDETRAKAARLGAAGYVVKPFAPAKLLRELAAAISPLAPRSA